MIRQDIKHALRSLSRKPSFTAVVVLTLAIGIGGTTAIFGAVNAVLLRPLPYPDPDQLVRVYKTSLKQPERNRRHRVAAGFRRLAARQLVVHRAGRIDSDSIALTGMGAAEQVPAGEVTGGFFDVMGTPPLLGRAITTADDPMGAPRRRGAEPRHLGAPIRIESRGSSGSSSSLDGVSREVIGVMPPGFQYPLRSEMWVPLRFSARDLETQRGAHYIEVIGRLKPGVSIERRARGHARRSAPGWRAIFRAPIATTRRRSTRCASRWSATSASRCSCCSAPSAWCC